MKRKCVLNTSFKMCHYRQCDVRKQGMFPLPLKIHCTSIRKKTVMKVMKPDWSEGLFVNSVRIV